MQTNMEFSRAENEATRLGELRRYNIVNETKGAAFDDFAKVALSVANTAASAVVFYGSNEMWVKGEAGYPFLKNEHQSFLCNLVIEKGRYIEVHDTLRHDSLKFSVLLRDNPIIRFIGKIPIISPSNTVLGSICILDDKPNNLTERQVSSLGALAKMIIYYLELKKNELDTASLILPAVK